MDVSRRRLLASLSGATVGLGGWLAEGGSSDGTAAAAPTATAGTDRPNPALRTDGGATTVPLVVDDAVANWESVHLPLDVRQAVGVQPGHQVRVRAAGEYAAFTVREGEGDVGRIAPPGSDRFRGWTGCFDATVDPQVVHPTLDLAGAREAGELVERVVDGNDDLVALAPHGGFVEPGTHEQALAVAETTGATAWYAAGYRGEGGAFERWHVTSTDISTASFPALGSIADRRFGHAVAFHGWGESGVGIGGAADRETRVAIRDAIAAVVPADLGVFVVDEGEYAGNTPDNLVNWLTATGASGVQLEQSARAREEFGAEIAAAVGSVLG
jgi:phage replication-related protein YjqB (UPF0714/DUF867 family)